MAARTVVLTDRAWPDAEIERSLCLDAGYELVEAPEGADSATLADLVRAAQPVGLLFCWAPITAAVLDAVPSLRVATRLGVGLDNIDLHAAARNAITVTRVPDYCIDDVSDHVVALVAAWARGIVAYDRDVHNGTWDPATRTLRRIGDLTVGVWGTGNIGRRVADKFVALGAAVLTDDRHRGHAPAGAQAVPVDDLVSRSDVLTLHLPATPETVAIIDASACAHMKPGSLLVNTSRGALVDLDALVAGLDAGHPGAAALDVLPDEPVVPRAIRARTDVILTPHVAFSSDSSLVELRTRATHDLLRVLRGEPPHNPVPLP